MGLLEGTDKAYYDGSDYGNYQFISLQDVVSQFMVAYVGEEKIINKVNRVEVLFHAQRALAEMSFDTFKSTKAQEIKVPNTLKMILPRDYVNYVKLTYSDGAGIERVLYPAIKTSNPTSISQNSDGSYNFTGDDLSVNADSETWTNYQSESPHENNQDDFDYDDDIADYNIGQRYGIDPAHAQTNGSFYIDELKGNIHFSSNLSGLTVTLKYISDSLGTDAEMQVHKFAEEAMYKQILYALSSSRINIPASVIARLKKEARASKRQAKLRLSNIKLEEITQILRGKSKQIKH